MSLPSGYSVEQGVKEQEKVGVRTYAIHFLRSLAVPCGWSACTSRKLGSRDALRAGFSEGMEGSLDPMGNSGRRRMTSGRAAGGGEPIVSMRP